jgi:hypothetical protein
MPRHEQNMTNKTEEKHLRQQALSMDEINGQ